jgi:hypothetical protein
MKKDLVMRATQLLRQNGFRADGRPRGVVATGQIRFERSVISTPMGGKPMRVSP